MLHLIAIATINTAFSWFIGSWNCHGTGYSTINTFTYAAGNKWIINRWGPKTADGGTAYIGYVSAQKRWIYKDFHNDGGFGDVTSTGPHDNVWIWSGPYYTPDGKGLHGRIIYTIKNKGEYDRSFEEPKGNGFKSDGGDVCTRLK